MELLPSTPFLENIPPPARGEAQRQGAQVALPRECINFMCTIRLEWLEVAKWVLNPAEVTSGSGQQGGPGLPKSCWAHHPPQNRAGSVGAVGKQ